MQCKMFPFPTRNRYLSFRYYRYLLVTQYRALSHSDIATAKGDGSSAKRTFDVVVRGATNGGPTRSSMAPTWRAKTASIRLLDGNRHLSQARAAANAKIAKYTTGLGKETAEQMFTPLAFQPMAKRVRKLLEPRLSGG